MLRRNTPSRSANPSSTSASSRYLRTGRLPLRNTECLANQLEPGSSAYTHHRLRRARIPHPVQIVPADGVAVFDVDDAGEPTAAVAADLGDPYGVGARCGDHEHLSASSRSPHEWHTITRLSSVGTPNRLRSSSVSRTSSARLVSSGGH